VVPEFPEPASFAAVLVVVTRSCVWIYTQGGAEHLAEHRRLFDAFPSSARGVKLLWAVISTSILIGWALRILTGDA
jgi:hypothetical protein